ncbi:MAG TPA: hypothetical protein PLO51_00205, partial [Candidatus Micrarchaeota archaeon]|nr:hypothetical protein [Candidatus Micrarchaeota archaeon]
SLDKNVPSHSRIIIDRAGCGVAYAVFIIFFVKNIVDAANQAVFIFFKIPLFVFSVFAFALSLFFLIPSA